MTPWSLSVVRLTTEGAQEHVEAKLEQDLAKAIPDLRIRELFLQRPRLLRSYDHVVVARSTDGVLAGILCCTWLNTSIGEVLNVGMQMIAPKFRSGRLFTELWRYELGTVLPLDNKNLAAVAVRTCNPRVYTAMRRFSRILGASLYPDVSKADQTGPLAACAENLSASLARGHVFDPRTGVIHGIGAPPDLYLRDPAADAPSAVNTYFQTHVTQADRLLCILWRPQTGPSKEYIKYATAVPHLRQGE